MAAWRWAGSGGALLDLSGPPSRSDGPECRARTFLTAASGSPGPRGSPHKWLDRHARGLAAGARTPGREDSESWPVVLDRPLRGRPMVESASLALGLRPTRPRFRNRLGPGAQDRERAPSNLLRELGGATVRSSAGTRSARA